MRRVIMLSMCSSLSIFLQKWLHKNRYRLLELGPNHFLNATHYGIIEQSCLKSMDMCFLLFVFEYKGAYFSDIDIIETYFALRWCP